MDKITDTKTEFRLRQWTQIIESCQSSGMTVVGWCNQNNVKTKSYYYCLRRIRSLACESGTLEVRRIEQPIVPLTFKQSRIIEPAAITIQASDAVIHIREGATKTTIEAVLLAVKSIC